MDTYGKWYGIRIGKLKINIVLLEERTWNLKKAEWED